MSSNDSHPRCAALTKAGEPCKNYALADAPFCRAHEGVAATSPPPPVRNPPRKCCARSCRWNWTT